MKMKQQLTLGTIAMSALLLTACGSGVPKDVKQEIEVSGQGEVNVVPDQFRINALATRTGEDINKMKKKVDREVNDALDLAKDLDIDKKNVRATGFTVHPEWQWQPKKKLLGHTVQRDIQFIVEGIENYADLLEGLSNIGFKNISNSAAELSDPSAAQKEAMEKAVQNAKEKAKVLAKASGRKLGPAIYINEQSGSSPMPRMVMHSAEAKQNDSAQYSPGEVTINQNVKIRFHLK